mmetsp:Transcript_16881/g.34439  ORF Transcript_16881/g.34439 Transcript_16881/m.34439 type:complete len:218 (-) Transcript_16881:206-859(-)|eukprot:CAMPEP_0113822866 /NCGR_PEP_ID=MMETSP0328-20130328/2457_1 /TAXON_ID=39455 /ORGANISM="Alexandrium minutum" /LENGTH=217 /DNA_ID=CAMNT_0000790807 /DNA_START=80 /DNA_END=733 /DNA_ORIENTATION=+ /assembly_acc=CAM_ASM_000350
MSPPQIQEILDGEKRYESSSIEVLQEHLKEQLQKGTYDVDANLALLKLYLLFPDSADVDMMEGILLKALMALPATDFSLCMYQIPEKHHQSLRDVVHLAQQLQMAKLKAFWKEAADVKVLSQAQGWEKAVRTFVMGVVASTYRSIKVEQLSELLNLPAGPELEGVIKEQAWTRSEEDKDIVVVSTKSFEGPVSVEPKPPTIMSLEQYRTLFQAASGA